MIALSELIQQGSSNALIFIPTAVLLGALHGLEPGHSKTMMASFIIAVRGTIAQAVLLGLCAALSHSLIVWALAAVALRYGNALIAEQAEPWFLVLSGLVVLGVAFWIYLRTRWDNLAAQAQQNPPHGGRLINTGHGVLELLIHDENGNSRFRLYCYDHRMRPTTTQKGESLTLATLRPDGRRQAWALIPREGYLESADPVARPHSFEAIITLDHGGHAHTFELTFAEAGAPAFYPHRAGALLRPTAATAAPKAPAPVQPEYQDAHERAHAADIERRFGGRPVTTGQIALFGLTGGLIPCPASVTVLMICLHLKRVALGATLVLCFSAGLALSLVSVGVVAAWGARQASRRFGGTFSTLARKMPYASSGLMALVGLVMGIEGVLGILG